MYQPNCAVCGQPAPIHETVVEAGTAVTRHFCEQHGTHTDVVPLPADAVQKANELYASLLPEDKAALEQLHRLTRRS